MTKQKFLQNGERTTIESEKKSKGAGTKENNDEKEMRSFENVEEREPAFRRWRNFKLQDQVM